MIVSEETAAKSLLSAAAVRERAHKMLALGDRLPNFRVDLARLDDTAQLVIDMTRAAYPTLDIPFHSRWRHFDIDGFDYWDEIEQTVTWPSSEERARSAFDLAIVSVLLDAGAGPNWTFRYPPSSSRYVAYWFSSCSNEYLQDAVERLPYRMMRTPNNPEVAE